MKINGGANFDSSYESSTVRPETPARLEGAKLSEFTGTEGNLCEVRDHRTDDPGFDVHVRDHRTDDPGFDIHVRDHRSGDRDLGGYVRDHRTHHTGSEHFPGEHVRDHRTHHHHHRGPIGDPTLAGEIRRLIGELEHAIHGRRGSGDTGICTPRREPIDADKISFRVNNSLPLDADKISFRVKE